MLVFDTEPDIDFFYGGESDSEEEFWEDEDDENGEFDPLLPRETHSMICKGVERSNMLIKSTAEGHYTADYPDDEVDSDDEYDQNPYSFRTGNASDMEEYGVEDDAYSVPSDDENRGNDGYRPKFSTKPWMKEQNI